MLNRFKNSSWILVLAVFLSLLLHVLALLSMNVYLPEQESPPVRINAHLLASIVPSAPKDVLPAEHTEVAPQKVLGKALEKTPSEPLKHKRLPKKPPALIEESAATQVALPASSSSEPFSSPDSFASNPADMSAPLMSEPVGQSEAEQSSGEGMGDVGMAEASTPIGTPNADSVPLVPDNWMMNGCIKYALTVRYGLLGGELGQAEHCWSRDDQAYLATLQGKASVAWRSYVINQRTVGAVSAGAPVPTMFSELSDGKEYETRFLKDRIEQVRNGNARQVMTGGGAALDMLSLMHFLSMLPDDVGAFDIFVVVNRGNVDRVTVLQDPVQREVFPTGSASAKKFHVEARNGELKIDVWIAKDVYNMPLRFRINNKGDIFDFQSIEITVGGNVIAQRLPPPPSPSGDD